MISAMVYITHSDQKPMVFPEMTQPDDSSYIINYIIAQRLDRVHLAFPNVRHYIQLSVTKQSNSNEPIVFPKMSQPYD